MSKEGAPAVHEAIDYLKKAKPVPALKWDENLVKSARDHLID